MTHFRKDKTHSLPRRLAVLLLCLLLALSLAGCSFSFSREGIQRTVRGISEFFFGDDTEETGGEATYNVYPRGGKIADLKTEDLRGTGTAGLLKDDVILIGIYVDDPEDPWTPKDLALVKKNMNIATAWLEEQAEANDIPLDIHFAEENTIFTLRDPKFSEDSTQDSSLTFNEQAAHYLSNLDVSDICEKYGTDNVGYLFFLHEDYGAYTWPFIPTAFSLDKYYYHEFCCLFLYDGTGTRSYDNPATYAHEILHLYGASDLYQPNIAEGITPELVKYVESSYPNEIMYYTYEWDNTSNYEAITKMMSPFTLYFIGWKEDKKILKKWPGIKREEKGVFPAGLK